MRIEANINPPTASAYPFAGRMIDVKNAAPGVDHAMLIGILVRRLKKIPLNPIATATAVSPDAACDCVAPTAKNPFTTIANELAKPTNDASEPAVKVEMVGPVSYWFGIIFLSKILWHFIVIGIPVALIVFQ